MPWGGGRRGRIASGATTVMAGADKLVDVGIKSHFLTQTKRP